jgi:hypothetical protein
LLKQLKDSVKVGAVARFVGQGRLHDTRKDPTGAEIRLGHSVTLADSLCNVDVRPSSVRGLTKRVYLVKQHPKAPDIRLEGELTAKESLHRSPPHRERFGIPINGSVAVTEKHGHAEITNLGGELGRQEDVSCRKVAVHNACTREISARRHPNYELSSIGTH